jgi:hypothetical protein
MAGVSAFFDHSGQCAGPAWALLMTRYRVLPSLRERRPWGEALSLPGAVIIGALTIRLERLIIPKALRRPLSPPARCPPSQSFLPHHRFGRRPRPRPPGCGRRATSRQEVGLINCVLA